MTEIDEKQIFSIVQKAIESGKVKCGVNEVTKSVERKQAKLVVYASDVSPKEIVAHLGPLSKEMDILCYEVGTKQELGSLLGIKTTSALSIVDCGSAKAEVDSLNSKNKKETSKKEEAKKDLKEEIKEDMKKEDSSKGE